MLNALKSCITLLIMAWVLLSCCSGDSMRNAPARLIVFGDSYSDNGNLYALTQHQYPNSTAYYQGRFSNGPVWSEYFAELLSINPHDHTKFINYAFAEAKIQGTARVTVYGHPDKQYSITDLSGQIDLYVKHHKKISENDLVVVFMSTNDFFDVTDVTRKNLFLEMADHQALQIKRLVQLGAKHVIVLNGRDVTKSMLAEGVAKRAVNSSDKTKVEAYLKEFRESIQQYNQRLAENLSHMKEVTIYDIFKFDHQTFKQMSQHGMCYQNSQGDYQQIAGSICNNPSQYFYYDRIHTTRTANFLLAKEVYKTALRHLVN